MYVTSHMFYSKTGLNREIWYPYMEWRSFIECSKKNMCIISIDYPNVLIDYKYISTGVIYFSQK